VQPKTEEAWHEGILRVLVYIQHDLDAELTLESLAGVARFSPYHFHRIFRALVGETVMAHVRRLRLERAAGRLLGTDEPVVQIALEAGYETHEAFTRAFRTMFGISPSEFRRRGGPCHLESPAGVHYVPGGEPISYHPPERGDREMEVTVETREPTRVAFVRHIGPYAECGGAWEKLCVWAGPKGLLGPGATFVGVDHDDPKITPSDKIRYDASVVVGSAVRPEGEIGVQELAGGDYAVAIHRGPYTHLQKTYDAIFAGWLPKSGYRLRDLPALEFYLNSPDSTPPEDLRTRVCVPVEKE
jgi:AraC family transcriptional regulator